MAFFFLKYLFFILEILTFFYYANKISDYVILFATKNGDIPGNIEAVFLKLDTINVNHKKKQNDTFNGVAIATLSAPVSFCSKNKFPHLQPLK